MENRIFGLAKTSGFYDGKWVHISNIAPLMIVESRELARQPKTDFPRSLGIKQIDAAQHLGALHTPEGVYNAVWNKRGQKESFWGVRTITSCPKRLFKILGFFQDPDHLDFDPTLAHE